METKTNAMRVLDKKKISYKSYHYDAKEAISAVEVASLLGLDKEKVFKTLVTVSKTGEHYVFMVPSLGELDLKKAAKAVGEKAVAMLPQKELFPLTGYVHGGCSPIGMKKQFMTVIDKSAQNKDTIIFSGGKIGLQIETALEELKCIVRLSVCDIVVKTE